MKKIELARLYQLTYITANVESYEQFNISFEIQKDKVHESNAYGNASLVSGDIEILFFWWAKCNHVSLLVAPEYHIEIDDSGKLSADINRLVIDDKGKELDQVSVNVFWVTLIKQHLTWVMAVDTLLTKPKLTLVKSA